MLYNIQNACCSLCLFCEYWFDIINYNMHYIHMCYKCLTCESKMASILNLIVRRSVGCPLNCPLFPFLKVVGCPLSCPLSQYMLVVGSLICMAKFPWAAHSTAHWAAHFFSYFEVVGCPLSCLLFPYKEEVGSLICMAKFLWATHGQPTPLPAELPTFVHILEAVGCLLSCPLSCPLFPYMEVVGSLICMAKFPWTNCQTFLWTEPICIAFFSFEARYSHVSVDSRHYDGEVWITNELQQRWTKRERDTNVTLARGEWGTSTRICHDKAAHIHDIDWTETGIRQNKKRKCRLSPEKRFNAANWFNCLLQ